MSLALPTFGPDAQPEGILRVCRSAQEMGYDSLWTGDRVRVPGTVPIPPAVSRCPREEEGQEASGTGDGPEAAE
ncbi:hypothetical protein ACNPQM_37980 [Streptomyces sp. NPDC056231]|uniref:hypothetical protein n=1 Tax=Streptomyces sp. NPDC056231 TaxID=3345755 RepID=UPI003AACE96F